MPYYWKVGSQKGQIASDELVARWNPSMAAQAFTTDPNYFNPPEEPVVPDPVSPTVTPNPVPTVSAPLSNSAIPDTPTYSYTYPTSSDTFTGFTGTTTMANTNILTGQVDTGGMQTAPVVDTQGNVITQTNTPFVDAASDAATFGTDLGEAMGQLAQGTSDVTKGTPAYLMSNQPGTIAGDPTFVDPQSIAGTTLASTQPDVVAFQAPQGLGQVGNVATVSGQIAGTAMGRPEDIQAAQIQAAQMTPSAASFVQAQTAELDEKATTQYQLEQILSSLEEGKPMPAWAAPAVRKVSAVMQARGMGASSMASAAMVQAVMESGITIAANDAAKYAQIGLANLTNRQQAALANAAMMASVDKANLSARQQAAVSNAQLLLQTDIANMSAQQKADTLEYNAAIQGMFKDAAEQNAAAQFNAKNQLQVEEFFAELETQVETANANRNAALEQFNAGEANAQAQFNATMRDARERFNANMQFAVDQSNVQWRRQINTANTATMNEAVRMDVQNTFAASQNAIASLWQKYRDNAAWNMQKGESYLQRAHEIGIMAMEFSNSKELYSQQQKDQIGFAIGDWIATWAGQPDE